MTVEAGPSQAGPSPDWRPVRFVADASVPIHIKNIVATKLRQVTARHVTERIEASVGSNLLASVAGSKPKASDDGEDARPVAAKVDSLRAERKRIFSSLADSDGRDHDGTQGAMGMGGQDMYTLRAHKTPAKRKRGSIKTKEDDEDEDDENEDDENEAGDPNDPDFSRPTRGTKTTPEKGVRSYEEQSIAPTEEFFARGADTATSDNTLARLKRPALTAETLQQVLQTVPGQHVEAKKRLVDRYFESYTKWRYQLYSGFNLLLYGYGSKKDVVEDFLKKEAKGHPYVVINGYFPSLNLKHVLNTITARVIGYDGSFTTTAEQGEFIKSSFASDVEGMPDHLFIGLHNIDGPMLRGDKAQTVLALLASVPQIHVIATVDHINAPLLWDHTKASLCNWVWYDTTTFQPYLREASYENSLIMHRGELATEGILCVLRSVPENTRGIFQILVDLQLSKDDDPDGGSDEGITFSSVLTQCREQFLVTTELNLRTQLTEFKDHEILRLRKGGDGQERLVLQVKRDVLMQVLEEMD